MKYYKEYKRHKFNTIKGIDDTIYTFDIETTSYLVDTTGNVIIASDYEKYDKKTREFFLKQATMYIWTLGINEEFYFGRTWDELGEFIDKLESISDARKIFYIHNLSFEFQFLKSVFHMKSVFARIAHKVMYATLRDYHITIKCSYFLSNVSLEKLSDLYNLDVVKQVGNLDYNKIRTSVTKLTSDELKYCEYDCLVLYHYIKREIEDYKLLKNIPKTSTGKVRRELTEITLKNYQYKEKVRRAINTDPHIYNLLCECFQGGYTKSSVVYTSRIIKNVDSWDICSSYPYVMTTYKYPSTAFKKANIKTREDMSPMLAYIIVVKFTKIKTKYFNTFISMSKCRNIKGGKYDNGRIISADEVIIALTDVDFKFLLKAYQVKEYEILESYFSVYNYLPHTFIKFVLSKYKNKTQYKGIDEMKLVYSKEKSKFNALYGMSVTNTIRDEVIYDDETGEWNTKELTNEEIEEKLGDEYKKGFLSFAYGVWVTSIARNICLLENLIKLDDYVIYSDTDSLKLASGYDKKILYDYNESVIKRIEYVAEKLHFNKTDFMPIDKFGISHPLGVFELETKDGRNYTYDEFITQGSKKYATSIDGEIEITVAGVPKEKGSKCLKKLSDFQDDFVFNASVTEKLGAIYNDRQSPITITDYQGNTMTVNDKTGICLIPQSYTLKKSSEYATLISDESSNRSIYKE